MYVHVNIGHELVALKTELLDRKGRRLTAGDVWRRGFWRTYNLHEIYLVRPYRLDFLPPCGFFGFSTRP